MAQKIIHMVWIGSDMPDLISKCIERCKEINTTADVMVWTELPEQFKEDHKLAISKCKEVCQVVDILRVWLCYTYGGFYIDSDIWCHRTIDDLFQHDFILAKRHQKAKRISNCVMGCDKGHPRMLDILKIMDTKAHLSRGDVSHFGFGRDILTPYCQENKDVKKLHPWMFTPFSRRCGTFWRMTTKRKNNHLNDMGNIPYGVHLFGILRSGKNKIKGKSL